MKKILLSLMICICMSYSAIADMKIVQKVDNSGFMGQPAQNMTVTMYIKGNKFKADQESMFTLIDLDQNKAFIVDHKSKMIMTATTDQIQQMAGMLGQLTGGGKVETKSSKTGTSKTVSGFKCDEYRVTVSGGMINGDSTYCYSTAVKTDEFKKFMPFTKDIAKQFGAAPTEIEGLPVESTSKLKMMGQEITSKSQVMSVSYDPVPATIFTLPEGYKTQAMPSLPHK